MVIMEPELASTSNNIPPPLFPAYSSDVQNQQENRDWLCNSSFAESTLKEVSSQLNLQNAGTSSETTAPVQAENVPIEISVETERRKKSHKKRKYEKYSNASFQIPESESVLSQLKKKTFIEETGLSFERAFQTDVTRDPDNLMYESFERTKIASYKTYFKIPVGLSSKELSWWSQFLPKSKEKVPSRYFNKSFLKTMKNASSEGMQVIKEPLQNLCLNYIPLSASHSPVHTLQSEKNESLPIFANVSSSWKLENKKSEATAEDKTSEALDNELRTQIIHYNKLLSKDPNNIEMWINFVDFQDKVFLTENACGSHVYSEKNLIEKKIAILEKALMNNPKDVRLNILKLKLSQNIDSPDKLTAMWEQLLFFNPNKPEVWQEYLLHSISNLTSFNVSNILKIYSKCLRTLSNVCEGVIKSHEPCPGIMLNSLGIVNQLCYLLKSCGYSEKAIAIYQALIEFNLFCDMSTKTLSVDEKVACFEPFWDSGAQRIGENNALGWATTIHQKKISSDYLSTDSDLNNKEDEILSKKLSIAQTWLEFERLRETDHWLPWRPNPEYDQTSDDVDDPDRTVTFDDVSKFLFSIQEEEHKFLLVMNFFIFLGFNPHFLGCHGIDNEDTYSPYCLDDYENISNQLRKSNLIHILADPFPIDTHWNEERCKFINNIFLQVLDTLSPKYKTLCTFVYVKFKQYLTLEVNSSRNKKDLEDLKKFVMGILKKKENRNCLLLWFDYIYIESLTDKLSAMKYFEKLLASSLSAISSGDMHLQELWYFSQAFIEIHMSNDGNLSSKISSENEIVWMLMHIANKEKYVSYSGQEIKPTVILKTVSQFKNVLEKELNLLDSSQSMLCYCFDPSVYSVINCAKCFAYFQYFSQGCEAAMQVYENVIAFMNSKVTGYWGRYISEQINIAQAKILNYHTWNSATSMKPLQTFLYNSVEKYPHNSQLLYLLVKLRSASSVISPTRRFLAQILRNQHKSHPETWFFALIAEFAICCSLLLQNNLEEETLRGITCSLGINWRIRSLFEKMLQSNVCAHISILWRSYLKFELMTQNIEKAKSVYHRALQNCGWSKELLMDVIENFPDKLEEILAFMNEKQIRIHTPLEEVTLLMEHVVTDS